jgi:hypothetical protein
VSPIAKLGTAPLQAARRLVVLDRFRRNLRLQDVAALLLNVWLCALAFSRARGPDARLVQQQTAALLTGVLITLLLTRAECLPKGALRSFVYRAGLFATVLGSYLVLHRLLPALQPTLLDRQLLAIDRTLFGQTPAIWLDRWVTPHSVEWFAFFYYAHYPLLAGYVLGSLLFDTGRRRYELLLGLMLVAAVGHGGYALVPGVGPYAYRPLAFAHTLHGGSWWLRVRSVVDHAGAGLDIFPSLHTAFSLMIGLHAFRHRRSAALRWLWLPTAMVVANLIVATMFLRWHYGVDVLAGAGLSWTMHQLAIRAFDREAEHTGQLRQEVWEEVLPSEIDPPHRIWLVGILTIHILALVLLLASGG